MTCYQELADSCCIRMNNFIYLYTTIYIVIYVATPRTAQ